MVDKVTIPVDDKSPTLEEASAAQDAAKAAAAASEAPLNGEPAAGERPAWLPEKFETPEAMAEAYAALETKQGAGEPAPEVAEAAEAAVEAAGLDMEALSTEYTDTGELSAESYAALEKAGISKEMVDQYTAGLEATSAAVRADLLAPVGGEEAYDAMIAWAGDNLPDADIDVFNSALESGDTNQMKMAVENLNTKFKAANAQEPDGSLNGKPSGNATTVYESTADLMKDMGNPEYQSNPAFRNKVAAKLERSSIL